VGPVKALGQHSLERAVRAAGIDAPPVWLDETGSTNDDALRLANEGAPEWTVVAAGHQTRGRGRLGRSWADTPGKALTFSVVLRPTGPPEEAPLWSFRAAVAVIAAVGHPELRSKWPNDLMVGERKAGGILAEARVSERTLRHVVVGIGINVAMAPEDFPAEIRDSATSLVAEGITGHQPAILEGTLRELRRFLDPGVVLDVYRPVCVTLGRRIRARTTDGEEVEGVAVDLDSLGGLVVETASGRRTVAFGEVAHMK
jgi:BirA family transcriptional regulator, biotin operon repressor / biotin---[acetyl-CoA-carboxylase] ligase